MPDTIELDIRQMLRDRMARLSVPVAIEDDGSEWISLDVLADRVSARSPIVLDVPKMGDADAA